MGSVPSAHASRKGKGKGASRSVPSNLQHRATAILERLPQVAYSAELFSGEPHPESCPICMEDFGASEQLASSTILLTPCLHAYHEHCLRGWLEKNKNTFCPSCRWDL